MLLLAVAMLSAGTVNDNRQKIFDIDSDAYRAVKALYISHGYALPSTSGPWSGAELEMMLQRLDDACLSAEEERIYSYAESLITEKPRFSPNDMFGFGIEGIINGEVYLHANKDSFTDPDEYAMKPGMFFGDYNTPVPLVKLPFETWISDSVYGYMSLDLGTVRNVHSLTDSVVDDNGNIIGYKYKGSVISHNLIFIPPTAFSDFNMNFPYRAFGSFGGSWWNVAIGRDRLSWGPGETGNFVIGDQLPYHNNARVSFFTDSFKYIFSASAFIHPMNYMKDFYGDGRYYYSPEFSQLLERQGVRMFISHRLEWRIFNKVNMALTEGIMYQSENTFDPLVLSPTAIFHNYYIRGNANSILSLEIDWAVAPHWNLYGQFVLDELQMFGEYTSEGTAPSGLGYMLGTKFSYPMGDGVLYGSIEAVYTDPYLYLRDDGTSYKGDRYGNNFVVAFPEFVSEDKTDRNLASYALQFLGYRYGGDAIVANINTGYEVFGKWYAEGNLMYMVHGAFNELTRWKKVQEGKNPSTPTSSLPDSESYDLTYAGNADAPEHFLIFTLEGGIEPVRKLELYSRSDLVLIWNKDNVQGDFAADFQFTAGVRYSI